MGCSASVNSPPETKKQTPVVKDAPLASRVTNLVQSKQATAWDKKMERRRSDAARRQEKQTECGSGPGFNCAASAMQGKRPTMEDAHIMNWGAYIALSLCPPLPLSLWLLSCFLSGFLHLPLALFFRLFSERC